ncbi:hypothetical protein [Flavivirga aquatica]|nr:hypothetical protein [Flavivirga aquatica]
MDGGIQMMSPEKGSMLDDFDYFVGNLLYIIAYLFLMRKICSTLCALHVLKNFKINLVVLTILNIYLVYVLQAIVVPFLKMNNDYYLELIYNVVLLLLLSVALLNYFYRDNKKSLYLFIGVLCIVFSEVIQIAYFYISERSFLSFIFVTLNLTAFHFLYQQTKLLNKTNDKENYAAVE